MKDESTLKEDNAIVVIESKFNPIALDFAKKAAEVKELLASDKAPTKEELVVIRKARINFRDLRIDVEKARKLLKEDALRRGQAIDSEAKELTAKIEPIEARLYDREKYFERIEADRLRHLKADREAALIPFLESQQDILGFQNVETMSDAVFKSVLDGVKSAYDKRIAFAKQQEAERKAQEEADRIERERVRLENEKLRKEAEEMRKQHEANIEKARIAREAAEQEMRKEREAASKEAARLQAIADEANRKAAEEARKAREAAEKIEADKRAAIAAEEKRIAKEKQEADEAAKAPDRKKVVDYVNKVLAIAKEVPELKTDAGKEVFARISRDLSLVFATINVRLEEL